MLPTAVFLADAFRLSRAFGFVSGSLSNRRKSPDAMDGEQKKHVPFATRHSGGRRMPERLTGKRDTRLYGAQSESVTSREISYVSRASSSQLRKDGLSLPHALGTEFRGRATAPVIPCSDGLAKQKQPAFRPASPKSFYHSPPFGLLWVLSILCGYKIMNHTHCFHPFHSRPDPVSTPPFTHILAPLPQIFHHPATFFVR